MYLYRRVGCTCRDIPFLQGEELHHQQCGEVVCVCVCAAKSCGPIQSLHKKMKDILRCHWEWHGIWRNNSIHDSTVVVQRQANHKTTSSNNERDESNFSRERIGVVFRSEPHRILGTLHAGWQVNSSWVSSSKKNSTAYFRCARS